MEKISNIKIPFGRFYIIAPEDASAGSVPAGFTPYSASLSEAVTCAGDEKQFATAL